MSITKAAQQYLKGLEHRLQRARVAAGRDRFSNFGEEQILRKYVTQLLPAGTSRTAVDIGAGDGVRGSNTYALFREGWRGVGFEGSNRKVCKLAAAYKHYPQVSAANCVVTPSNVVPLLRAYDIEREFGVLSLDIDSYDYWVLDAVLSEFRPRVVVTEINEKIPPPVRFVVKYDPAFQMTHHFFGYSIQSLAELAARHDYAILEVEYNNAFLAPSELPGVNALDAATAYRRGYLERPDRREKFPANANMEILHTLSPAEVVKFLDEFYARHRGKYELSAGDAPGDADAGRQTPPETYSRAGEPAEAAARETAHS
ncbi:MAG TPA: hypothetical protein VGX24_09770 [Pyrinomonadaceae bacterium]|jgi:hypothetical protein|nr:hypothetical protein [Pyrinomonadaceae bacterium]